MRCCRSVQCSFFALIGRPWYTPKEHWYGNDTLSIEVFFVADGNLADSRVIFFHVRARNDPPVLTVAPLVLTVGAEESLASFAVTDPDAATRPDSTLSVLVTCPPNVRLWCDESVLAPAVTCTPDTATSYSQGVDALTLEGYGKAP